MARYRVSLPFLGVVLSVRVAFSKRSCPYPAASALTWVLLVGQRCVTRLAKLAERAECWRHSSARFHLRGKPDGLTVRGALDEEIPEWKTFLRDAEVDSGAVRRHTASGRPLGSGEFVDALERLPGRPLRPRLRGRRGRGRG
jgi:hypothetical protein